MKDLIALKSVLNAKFQAEQAALRDILQEENRLRTQIRELDEQGKGDIALALKSLGNDVRWRVWVANARTKLNTELARVLARKEQATARLRREFGKVQASEQVLKAAEKNASQERAKRALTTLIEEATCASPDAFRSPDGQSRE